MPNWQRILIHHSASPDTPKLDTKAIKRFHVEERGWDDIGYHALVELVGDSYVAVPGRPLSKAGAHCPGQNKTALGLCLVGDWRKEEPPLAQLERAAELCAEWCVRFGIQVDEIRAHREFRSTVCPGLVSIEKIRRLVSRFLFMEAE